MYSCELENVCSRQIYDLANYVMRKIVFIHVITTVKYWMVTCLTFHVFVSSWKWYLLFIRIIFYESNIMKKKTNYKLVVLNHYFMLLFTFKLGSYWWPIWLWTRLKLSKPRRRWLQYVRVSGLYWRVSLSISDAFPSVPISNI